MNRWPDDLFGNQNEELSVQVYEVLQARQQVAMRRIRTIKQRMDIHQQSRLGKSARRIFPELEIAELARPRLCRDGDRR